MKTTLFLILMLGSRCALGQNDQAEFASLIGKITSSLGKVQTGSKTVEQRLVPLEFSSVRYEYDEIDQKGTKVTFIYEFNFADMDPYAVRQVTQKDLLLVVLAVRNKQKLVKVTKNGEQQSYEDEVSIHAENVDRAREVLDIAKQTIPIAEKITNGKLKLTAYDDMVAWLCKNVKDVSTGTKSINQSLAKGEYPGHFKLLQVESDGKTSHQQESFFNLADVNLNALAFKISGNRFSLNLEMSGRLKAVKVLKDGQPKAFSDDLMLYTNNVDEARDIRTVITLAAPQAQEKIKASLPSLKTTEDAVNAMATLTKDVKIGDKTEGQSLTAKCLTTYTLVEQTSSTTVKNVYTFNWMDANTNTLRIDVSGEKMVLDLPMLDKKKVVMYYKNDKFDGYESELNIFVTDMEVGRRIREAADRAINQCKGTYKDPFEPTTASIVAWMKTAVGEVILDQVTQKATIENPEPDNLNKLKITTREIKSNASVEEIFEVNLSDINANSVDYEIKSKWLFVRLETNFKNKIIKAYKDGKIQPYEYSVSIPMKDIETSRSFIAGVKKCIELSKTK